MASRRTSQKGVNQELHWPPEPDIRKQDFLRIQGPQTSIGSLNVKLGKRQRKCTYGRRERMRNRATDIGGDHSGTYLIRWV